MPVWYRVRDLDAGRAFYRETLGFEETYVDHEGRWARLERSGMEIALAEGEPEDGGVAHVDVVDVKAEAERGVAAASIGPMASVMRVRRSGSDSTARSGAYTAMRGTFRRSESCSSTESQRSRAPLSSSR